MSKEEREHADVIKTFTLAIKNISYRDSIGGLFVTVERDTAQQLLDALSELLAEDHASPK